MSHKYKIPVKFIGAPEMLAAAESIEDGKVLKQSLSVLLDNRLRLLLAMDSRDLTSLIMQPNSVHTSIHADANVIRYEY